MTGLLQSGWILIHYDTSTVLCMGICVEKYGGAGIKMSVGTLVLTIIIVFAIYFYMRHSSKKRQRAMDEIDTVRYYHENYLKSGRNKKRQTTNTDSDNGYRTYVTKYNSSEDYRERKGL